MDTNESLTEVEAVSSPRAQVIAMLLAGQTTRTRITRAYRGRGPDRSSRP